MTFKCRTISIMICIGFIIPNVLFGINRLERLAEESSFAGIGVNVAQLYDPESTNKRGNLIVLSMDNNGPAAKAGLQPGDIITEIDGKNVIGLEFEYIVISLLRGKEGTMVKIRIKRYEQNNVAVKEYFIMRQVFNH